MVHSRMKIRTTEVNKSHSVSYAYISYYTAFLKHHYTIEFFTALMTIFGDNKDKLLEYIKDAQDFGIQVTVPSINHSEDDFSIKDDTTIVYGFGSVKGLPERAVEALLEARPFDSVEDIVEKTEKRNVNKSAVDGLVWSGALDELYGTNRLDTLKQFYTARGDKKRNDDLPDKISRHELLTKEQELLGIYLSGHPLDEFDEDIDWDEARRTLSRINAHAIVTGARVIQTKKGDDMAFVDLEFKDYYVNAVMFPNVFSKEVERRKGSKITPLGRFAQENIIVKVSAHFNEDHRGGLSFIIQNMTVPVRVNELNEERLQQIEEDYGYEPKEPPAEPNRPSPKVIDF